MEVCLVHLAWAGDDPSMLPRFLDSYREHPAGVAHRLVIAWNGYRDDGELAAAQRRAQGTRHDDFVVARPKLDLAAYRDVAEWATEPVICFVNSHSRVLADGWLASMARCLAEDGVGLVGATGSWESPLSGAILPLRLRRAGRYPAFPNPHIRTNAFMLERRRLLDIRWPEITSKGQAYELESGNDGITRQIEAQGLRAVVVGRDGRAYDRDRWRESRTFRAGEQDNLLVEDNRTRQYEEAQGRWRRKLARLAWGQPLA
ncbi:MAG: hypothetical protein ACXVSE_17015 [Solirubrobacteraceae bacterium]